MKTRRYIRVSLVLLILVAAAWLLPFLFSTRRYHRPLEARLQQILGQRVVFDSASIELLPRPGFSLINATILEDSDFGAEPFARVDRIDCDVAFSDLLNGRIDFPHLRLESASINLVRNAQGRWNFESLLNRVPGPSTGGAASARAPATLDMSIHDARINFKLGADKKPFAITGVGGNLRFNRAQRSIDLDLAGTPLRADLSLPSPGALQLSGHWEADGASGGALDATIRTRGALLYDWIPLLSGRNPGLYGLIDADAYITGSLDVPQVEARAHLSQLRRWDSLPPAGDFPVDLSVKGRLDRRVGRVLIEGLEARFGSSAVKATGTVAEVGRDPELDLVAGLESVRIEDFLGLAWRLNGQAPAWNLGGRADGQLTVNGPWSRRVYAGLLRTHAVALSASGRRFPLSDTIVRADGRRIEFTSVRINAGSHLSILAEGALNLSGSKAGRTSDTASPVPGYELKLSTNAAPLAETAAFARALGVRVPEGLNLRGSATADLALTGSAWPPARPTTTGHAELEDAQVWLPGLSQPLEVSSAHISLDNSHLEISPLTATLGQIALAGRLERAGTRPGICHFDLQSPALDLREASSTLEVFGNRTPVPWFENIPGLSTFAARRAAGTDLLKAVNAQGEFSTPVLTYGPLTLREFRTGLEISNRLVRVSSAVFRTLAGRGQGSADFDLGARAPHLTVDFSAGGVRVENWAAYLPPQLASIRGTARFAGRFSSQGASRGDLESNLEGRASLHLSNIDFGHFDLLREVAQAAAWGDVPLARIPLTTLRSADLSLEVRNRRVILKPARVEVGDARFELAGNCGFDRKAQIEATADFRHVGRHRLEDRDSGANRVAHFRLLGRPGALAVALEDEAARSVTMDDEP